MENESNHPCTEKAVDTSDDLYGDLDEEMNHQNPSKTNIRNNTSATSNSKSEAVKKSNHGSNDNTISLLEKKIKRLEGENESLKRNMGTLYRTAKLELDRKDAMIADLERQLQ